MDVSDGLAQSCNYVPSAASELESDLDGSASTITVSFSLLDEPARIDCGISLSIPVSMSLTSGDGGLLEELEVELNSSDGTEVSVWAQLDGNELSGLLASSVSGGETLRLELNILFDAETATIEGWFQELDASDSTLERNILLLRSGSVGDCESTVER